MKTATSVCVIQCRIETNVADRPCRILCPFYMLAVVLDIIHGTTQKDTGKLKSLYCSWRNVSSGESSFPVLNR